MTGRLKIDLISDVVCPWCIIGYRRLQQAIEALAVADGIDIEWQPFELNPGMPPGGEPLRAHIARKYGASPQEYGRTQARLEQLGAELGFRFDFFVDMKIVNTTDAHILLDHARDLGQQTELQLRLFKAYFNERKDISDRQLLETELRQLGLDADGAMRQLENQAARVRMKTTARYWQGRGVSAVPTMVFNRGSALTGAQPVAVYRQVLAELLAVETGSGQAATP